MYDFCRVLKGNSTKIIFFIPKAKKKNHLSNFIIIFNDSRTEVWGVEVMACNVLTRLTVNPKSLFEFPF